MRHNFVRVLHMLIASAFASCPLSAQIYDVTKSTGSPTTPFSASNLESVDLASGNLKIRIPLVHLPGRGLDTDIILTYDSKIWTTGPIFDQFGNFQTYVAYFGVDSNYPPYNVTGPGPFPAAGWSVGVPRMGRWSSAQPVCYGTLSPDGTCSAAAFYRTWLTTEGIRFPTVDRDGLLQWNGNSPPPVTGYWSYDGSYMLFPSAAGLTGYYKDGTSVTVSDNSSPPGDGPIPQTLKDTNGNFINCGSSGCTDTSGRTITYFYDSSSNMLQTISYKDASGNPQTITFAFQMRTLSYPWVTQAPPPYNGSPNAISREVLTSVTLPNGKSYVFEYLTNDDGSTTGEISKITLPSGGYIRYTYAWTDDADPNFGSGTLSPAPWIGQFRAVATRSVSSDGTSASEQTWSYAIRQQNPPSFSKVSDPLGNSETLVCQDQPNGPQCSLDSLANYPITQSQDPSGTVLKTSTKAYSCYADPYFDPVQLSFSTFNPACTRYVPTSQTTTLNDTNQQSQTTFAYGTYGNIISKLDYDWGVGGAGSLLKRTDSTFLHDSNSTYVGLQILDRVASQSVYDASSSLAEKTLFEYDNYTQGLSASGAIQHDANFGTSFLFRGNKTAVSRWRNTDGVFLVTRSQYNDAGNVFSTTDPAGHTTTFSYADSWGNAACAPSGGNAAAYLTKTTNPLGHVETRKYDSCTGAISSQTDPNGQTTSFAYDGLGRPTQAIFPDDGVSSFTYNDTPGSVTVETKRKIDSSRWTDSFDLFDGLGRPIAHSTANDELTPWDRTDTCYDGPGRVGFVSYPFQASNPTSAPNCSGAGDSFTYDALGRTTRVTHSDGSFLATTYTGRATQVADEGNGTRPVQRVSQVDGLGRLTSVCEVTSAALIGGNGTPSACGQDIAATGFLTSYDYDALDNLVRVSQSGLTGREFSYDSLSRLIGAFNPESGPISYNYDSDPNNCPPPNTFTGDLVSKLDARGIVTCMQYDVLHRLTAKNYSDGTPAVSYGYDQGSYPLSFGLSAILANTIGRKSSQTTAAPNPTAEIFSYDALGRPTRYSQCYPPYCPTRPRSTTPYWFDIRYSYDFMGNMTSQMRSAVENLTLTHFYNLAGRLTSTTSNFSDSTHPGILFSSATYNAAGQLTSAQLGNGINESRSYDNRLRLTSVNASPAYTLTMTAYAPNGNILELNDSINGTWAHTYDDFNRLLTSNRNNGQNVFSYDYDRYGNRWHQNGPNSSQLSFSNANNQMDGYSYDATGNLLNDGTHSYTFDAENRISQVDGGVTASYVYYPSGERAAKTTPSGTVYYAYDLAGHQITEGTSPGNWNRSEIFVGDRHLDTYANGPSGATFFIHADWLGTERVRSTVAGAACETIISLPFGDGQSTNSVNGGCGDPSPLHFTGKVRDTETNLDDFGARYNSSSLGRFMSPDSKPLGNKQLSYPQDLNLYTYTVNNPVRFVDRDGQDWAEFVSEFIGAFHQKMSVGVGAAKTTKVLGTGVKATAQLKITADINTKDGIKVVRSAEAGASISAGGIGSVGPNLSLSQTILTVHPDGSTTGAETPTKDLSIIRTSSKDNSVGASTNGEITLYASEQNVTVPAAGGIPVTTPVTVGNEISVEPSRLKQAFFVLFAQPVPPPPPPPTPPPPPPCVNARIQDRDKSKPCAN